MWYADGLCSPRRIAKHVNIPVTALPYCGCHCVSCKEWYDRNARSREFQPIVTLERGETAVGALGKQFEVRPEVM